MSIEIVPKQKVKVPIWVIILFIACIIGLALLAASYYYFYTAEGKAVKEISEIKMSLIKTSSERVLEERLLLQEKRVNDFSKLLSGHQKTVQVFSFLEGISHPNVWFSDFDFNAEKGLIGLSAKAGSFITAGQQILVLKAEELIKNVNLSGISMSEEGEITFDLQLTVDPKVFQ